MPTTPTEYLYQVLVRNGCKIPAEGLYIIRYHSFYAHHQANAYTHLCDDRVCGNFLPLLCACVVFPTADIPPVSSHK